MEKKTIYYIVGGIAVLGIGYYLYNKSKKNAEEKETTDDTAKTDVETDASVTEKSASTPATATSTATTPATATSGKSAPATASKPAPKKLTAQELEAKLQSGCGKKPRLKKNKKLYDLCRTKLIATLTNKGLVAFDGSYGFEGLSEMYEQNIIREKSFAEQVINREDGRMFAGNVYEN
jgi:cytoskeletal protein RodZ